MGGAILAMEPAAASRGALAAVVLYALLILAGTVTAVLVVLRALHDKTDWEGRIAWLRGRPWSWREGLAVLALVGMLILLVNLVASHLHNPPETLLLVLQSLLLDLAGILGVAWLVHKQGWSWTGAFGMGRNPARWVGPAAGFYLALMPFLLFASVVYQGILVANGYPPSLQEIAKLISGDHPLWLRLYLGFLAVALAPLFEELVFRGVVLPLLSRSLGLGAGIFLTSLLFAAIHLHLPSLAPLLVVATGFSLAYVYTRSLWVPVIMHGIFNGVNLALLLALRN